MARDATLCRVGATFIIARDNSSLDLIPHTAALTPSALCDGTGSRPAV